MAKTTTKRPVCIVIAGPNGAGKTTFAREFLLKDTRVIHFVNADLIASGLSTAAAANGRAGSRAYLSERARPSCQIPRALRVREHVKRARLCSSVKARKVVGYRIEIVYLRLRSPQLALRRIAARVKQGGHDVPRADVLRRFTRSWTNFQKSYRLLADTWSVYDNSGRTSQLLERGP